MVLVDTSVWIDHFRLCSPELCELLEQDKVICHPWVAGELACGNLRQRAEILALLGNLPEAVVASNSEILFFIETRKLMGRGVGYVDAHLLASVSLTGGAALWTVDKRLKAVAADLNLAYE